MTTQGVLVVVPLEQLPLWGSDLGEPPATKPVLTRPATLRLLITVKAAPNPSARYGGTVCVGALGIDPPWLGWVRLYPVHYRELDDDSRFHKYDIVRIEAIPAKQDQRRESWKPIADTIATERQVVSQRARRHLLDPVVEDSMCQLNERARNDPSAKSIALVRVADISTLNIKRRGGWSAKDQKKIDAYLNQLDLLEPVKRTPLEAPRFTGTYHYRCADRRCHGHQQTLWDWDFVDRQRRLRGLTDAEAKEQLRRRFYTHFCAADRDVAFYVGNQAARPQSFSIGGVYAPRRATGRYRPRADR